jgi:hypothetical protein
MWKAVHNNSPNRVYTASNQSQYAEGSVQQGCTSIAGNDASM